MSKYYSINEFSKILGVSPQLIKKIVKELIEDNKDIQS